MARSDDAEGQRLARQAASSTGSASILAALEAARGAPGERALDGAADDLVHPREVEVAAPVDEMGTLGRLTAALIASQIDPALGERLLAQSRALHAASQQSMAAVTAAASTLRGSVAPLIDRLAQHRFDGDAMHKLLRAVLREAATREYTDFAAAEQATMAVAAILNALKRSGQIDEARFKRYNDVLDRAYKAVERDEMFKPADFIAALDALDQVVQK